jgi:hypothetical protein
MVNGKSEYVHDTDDDDALDILKIMATTTMTQQKIGTVR